MNSDETTGLYGRQHCETGKDLDYSGKYLILDPAALNESNIKPENQIFYASGGFGCQSPLRKVMGFYAVDGVSDVFYRNDFLGVLKEDLIPQWAKDTVSNHYSEQNSGPTLT